MYIVIKDLLCCFGLCWVFNMLLDEIMILGMV